MSDERTQRIEKKLNDLGDDTAFPLLTELVIACIIDAENPLISKLPAAKFSTNMFRLPLAVLKPSINSIVKKNIFRCLGKEFSDSNENALRNYLANGYIISKSAGQVVVREL